MTPFVVRVLGFTELAEIEGSWTDPDFARLFELLGLEGAGELAGGELREMCLLGLQDLKPQAAAALLLTHRLGDELGRGQIQNVSTEMLDEKLWEEYADMPLHERLFHVGSLLHQAFPGSFPEPDAVEARLEITAETAEARRDLAGTPGEPFVVRLLAHGMPDTSPLNRLFGDAVAGAAFPEAASIAWIVEWGAPDGARRELRVLGSGYWLDALRGTKSYGSSARAEPAGRG